MFESEAKILENLRNILKKDLSSIVPPKEQKPVEKITLVPLNKTFQEEEEQVPVKTEKPLKDQFLSQTGLTTEKYNSDRFQSIFSELQLIKDNIPYILEDNVKELEDLETEVGGNTVNRQECIGLRP